MESMLGSRLGEETEKNRGSGDRTGICIIPV